MADAALVVDKKGLAKKLAHKPKVFIVHELAQNAWDEDGVTEVVIKAKMLPGRPVCRIEVWDDAPEGFQDLASVYTLFRDSKKAPDPTKRGRFELGEKLVSAVALYMKVITTKGCVVIEGNERRHPRNKLRKGSGIFVDIRMNREEYRELCSQVEMLIPPNGITTSFNGTPLKAREPEYTFEATLQTIRSDEEGNLKSTSRKTEVRVYEPLNGEVPSIYELGIPVVPTGDRWHYDVQQRVPVNWERNNVPPSFLKTLRVEAINAMSSKLSEDDAHEPWVTEAVADPRCEAAAVKDVVVKRFGEKAVIADPSDPEGTKIAVSRGYTVIPGGALPRGAWNNVRTSGAVLPAGQVTPSPKPYDPDGEPEKVIPVAEWTDDMRRIATFAKAVHKGLRLDSHVNVVIVREPMAGWVANYGKRRLCLNFGRLGKKWFARAKIDPEVTDLLLHEFAHAAVSDHLSDQYHRECTRLGAELAKLVFDQRSIFEES
jgi:hypothetical protein